MIKKNHFVISIIIVLILTGCAIKDDDTSIPIPAKESSYFTLEFTNKKCNSKEKVIYTFEDGQKIYSRCGNVYYVIDNNRLPLSDALDSNEVTIEDITSRMKAILGVYDGGTIVYEYNKDNNVLGNSSFRLEKCNQINGSKDMLFLAITSDNYKCA